MTHERLQEREALVALTRLVEPPSPPLARLVADWGAVAVVEAIAAGDAGDLPSPAHAGAEPDPTGARPTSKATAAVTTRQRLERWRRRLAVVDVDRDLRLAERVGARLVIPGDAEWPPGVDVLGDSRPLALWVRGPRDLAEVSSASVAVVGARACTAYGEHVAASLASGLAGAGWTVVSGGAFGIDAAAHRGALAAEASTVAVLACGVDLAYPRAHEGLLARIAAEGLLVSEYAPGSTVTRGRFLERNRLLAALSVGTVLVEAGLRSGARSTVKHARVLNRPVMVVPGPVTSPASAGCHAELRSHYDTHLVTDCDDVLEVCGPLRPGEIQQRRGPVRPLDVLGVEGLLVFDAMPVRTPITVDALAVGTGLRVPDLLGHLAQMAQAGLVEPAAGGWVRRPSVG